MFKDYYEDFFPSIRHGGKRKPFILDASTSGGCGGGSSYGSDSNPKPRVGPAATNSPSPFLEGKWGVGETGGRGDRWPGEGVWPFDSPATHPSPAPLLLLALLWGGEGTNLR